ncbi:MAG: helix-turn-helix transcriptional regulator [Oscillospiraceae bacterium]|nr:helix-turn-helix transcriptional regulator [Oscillospiraceae bacterium]
MTNLEQENKEIGFRIRAARKAKRLNQTEFAELLNKSLRTVQKYESGEIEVSVAVIKEIAKVLECSPSYLLGWDEENKVLANFSDVVRFVFELDKTNELKFNIDVKKPPIHDGWECSITFDGKNTEGKLNTDLCLFLEELNNLKNGRTFMGADMGIWKEKTLAYYSKTPLTQKTAEELKMQEEQLSEKFISKLLNE